MRILVALKNLDTHLSCDGYNHLFEHDRDVLRCEAFDVEAEKDSLKVTQ